MGTGEPVRLQVTGPLAPFEAGFRAELERLGYTSRSARALVRVMARLSGWLEETGLPLSALTPPVVANLRAELSGLGPVLGFLRGIGVVPDAESVTGAGPVEAVLAAFGAWLLTQRGLAAESVRCYVVQARPFLASLPRPLEAALEGLDAGRVTSFMISHCRGRNTWSAKATVTAVRSLPRFLHVAGHVPVPLAAAVPSVARWRLDSLPRGLGDGQIGGLLSSCDVGTVVGRRDYALLTVLARLGLRGAEVAALRLGDIDWHGGQLLVRGKGNRIERLPLPVAVGGALAAYVTGGRPRRGTGPVFFTVRAPYRGLSPGAVRAIVARACGRAGLGRLGAHRLRHTLAAWLAPRRSAAERDRAGPASPQPAGHRDLRQGRPARAGRPGPSMADRCAMSRLRTAAEDYLAMRRALGFKLTTQGRLLMSFVDYCQARHTEHITTELALAWATQPPRGGTDQVYWSRRLMVVRIFARHLQALDPATEVPPADVLAYHCRRITPHVYSQSEIVALMGAAGRLTPGLRGDTWQTFIGLLATTGMRVSEVCRLDRSDVDLRAGVLTVVDSKFGKSRQVLLHPSSVAALAAYERLRNRHCPRPRAPSFLVSTRGTRVDASNVQRVFADLVAAAGISPAPGRRRPRLHDLRHTFAVATLLEWYRDGGDVAARLPLLSTWLGHVDPKSTYWYLQAVPELLSLAARRLEHALGESP